MANDTEVLKQFLVSLGFQIDESGLKKFRSGLNESTKDALKLGASVIGVGFAVEKFVESMANGLARLFYMSERTGATVAGLKATASAFEGIGLKAGVAEEAIASLGSMLRKPGTESLLRGWGINTHQPTQNVALDTADMLSKMYNAGGGQRYTAIQLAQNWMHMSEDDFVQMTKELPNLHAQLNKANEIIKLSGQNWETAATQGAEFNRQLGIIGQEIMGLGAKWLHLNGYMNDSVDTAEAVADILHRMLVGDWKNLFKGPDRGMHLKPEDQKRLDQSSPLGSGKDALILAARAAAVKYGIDPVLFMSQIQQESGFNPQAKSKAGAVGIAQFMPATAKAMGFEAGKDANRDLLEAARLMKDLLVKYKGDYTAALQAYNAGEPRIDAYRGGRGGPLTPETINYPEQIYNRANKARLGSGDASGAPGSRVFAPQVTQNFNITGSDANSVGEVVQSKVRRTNGDLLRDGVGMLGN